MFQLGAQRADNGRVNTLRAPTFPGIATVLGWQEDGAGGGFWLYNLLRDIPGHPAFSTVSLMTVAGFASSQAAN